MFIPNFLLKKEKDKKPTEITKEAITQHQNICKLYFSYYKSFVKLNPNDLENNVIDWLFSHDIVNLSCLLSLDNNFTSKFIFYLFKKVVEDTKTQYIICKDNFQQIQPLNQENKFMPLISYHCSRDSAMNASEWRKDHMIDEIERILTLDANKLAYSTAASYSSCLGSPKAFSISIKPNSIGTNSISNNSRITTTLTTNTSNNNRNNMNSVNNNNILFTGEDLELLALFFFKNILFFTLSIFNDSVTLNNEIISNKDKFKELLKAFSFGKCFRSIPKCHLFNDKKANIYNVDLPEWFEYDRKFNVGYILSAIWEQTIMIRYVIFQIKKIEQNYNISNAIISSKLSEFFIKRKNIVNYLSINFPKDKVHLLIAKIMLPKLHQLVMKDTSIKEKYYISNNNIFCKISKTIFEPINLIFDEEFPKMEEKFKEMYLKESTETFVEELLFINPTRAVTFDNFIAFLIYEQLGDYFSNDLIHNLFNEEESNSLKDKDIQKEQINKKKKKNKGKKEKAEEKEKEKEKQKESEIINSNYNNYNNNNNNNYNSSNNHSSNNNKNPIQPKTAAKSKTKFNQNKVQESIKEKFTNEFEEENNTDYDEIILKKKDNLSLNRLVNQNKKSDLSSLSVLTNCSNNIIKEQNFTESAFSLSKMSNYIVSSDFSNPITNSERLNYLGHLENDDSWNMDSNNLLNTQKNKKDFIIDIINGIIKEALNTIAINFKKEKKKVPFLYETKAKQPKKSKKDSQDSKELIEITYAKGSQKPLINCFGNEAKSELGNCNSNNTNSIKNIYSVNSIYNSSHPKSNNSSVNEVIQLQQQSPYSNVSVGNGIRTFNHNIINQNSDGISNNKENNKPPPILVLNKTKLNISNDCFNNNTQYQSNTGNLENNQTSTPRSSIEMNSSLTPKNENTLNIKKLNSIQLNGTFINNNTQKTIISPKNYSNNSITTNNNNYAMISPKNPTFNSCFSPNQNINGNINNLNTVPQPFNFSNFISSLTGLPTNMNMNMNNPNNKYILNTPPYLLFPSTLSNSNMGFSKGNKFNSSLKNKDFNEQMNKEIDTYILMINKKLEMMKPIKESLIEHLKLLSKENITSEIEYKLYGSFISDTAIEASDIDIRINFLCLQDNIPAHLAELTYGLKQSNFFKCFQHITTASIPVIKIDIDLNDIMSDYSNQVLKIQDKKPKYRFSVVEEAIIKKIHELLKNNPCFSLLSMEKQEEICNIKIDITYTIHNTDNTEKNNHVFRVLDYINIAKNRFNSLRTILILFKKLFESHKFSYDSHKLNDSWHGGLSSYCLFLLIVACLQYIEFSNYKLTTPAENFIFILNFYSYCFNFSNTVINLSLANPFNFGQTLETIPTILDPLTSVNASKSCYRILDVQEKLKKIFSQMMELKEKFDKKALLIQSNNHSLKTQLINSCLNNNIGGGDFKIIHFDNNSTNSSNLGSNIPTTTNSGNIIKQSNSDNASVYSSSENGDSSNEQKQFSSEFWILKDILL